MVNKLASGRIRKPHPDNRIPVAVASGTGMAPIGGHPSGSGCELVRQSHPEQLQRQLRLRLVDGKESQAERLQRVLAGSPLLVRASELPLRVFDDAAYREATQLAKAGT